MAALDGEAKQRGVTILNEMGLDPGLDHLSAIRIIDEARSQGDKVRNVIYSLDCIVH